MMSPFTVRPARADDLMPAFRLMFQRHSVEEREARIANALYLLTCGELEQEGVLVAAGAKGLVGALVGVPLRGASGLVWPPQTLAGRRQRQVEDALVQQANYWLRQRGTKVVQALLAPDEGRLADPLLRNGFVRVTSLRYMGLAVGSRSAAAEPIVPVMPDLTFVSYDEGVASRFEQTLLRSYENTLDCPELNGVRHLHEIMEGHKAQGLHDPGHWWLAEESGQPAGVLLMADVPDLGGWDLSYLGVVPEARGRGIGRALARKAIAETRAAGVERLTLAVDGRNHPALHLYASLGFEVTEEREVYLAFYAGEPKA